MLRFTKRRIIGFVHGVNVCLLIALTIFVAQDYVQTVTAWQALVPEETEIVSEDQGGLSPSVIEKVEPFYPSDTH